MGAPSFRLDRWGLQSRPGGLDELKVHPYFEAHAMHCSAGQGRGGDRGSAMSAHQWGQNGFSGVPGPACRAWSCCCEVKSPPDMLLLCSPARLCWSPVKPRSSGKHPAQHLLDSASQNPVCGHGVERCLSGTTMRPWGWHLDAVGRLNLTSMSSASAPGV